MPNTARRGGWILTCTGRKVYPFDCVPSEISIIDIARALSNLCRFTGHTNRYYSVAQHSVLCSQAIAPEFALWGLLHDAAEAYINDISTPLKASLFVHYPPAENWFESVAKVEARLQDVIGLRFGLEALEGEARCAVDEVDAILLATEARDLMPKHRDWPMENRRTLPERIEPWPPLQAEREFLLRFQELYKPQLPTLASDPDCQYLHEVLTP